MNATLLILLLVLQLCQAQTTCKPIDNCVQSDCHKCHQCDLGFFPVKENTTCYDVMFNHDAICNQTHKNICYNIFKEELRWDDARAVCKERKGHLFVPVSNEEESFLEHYLISLSAFTGYSQHKFWIGGKVETKTVWQESLGLGISRWVNTTKDHTECVAFSGKDNFLWQKFNCDDTGLFICKETERYRPSLLG